MSIRNEVIEPEGYYHIFNRGVNKQVVFYDDDNYIYFLSKVSEYLKPVLDVYAYCLMPNHFHLLVKIKSESDLERFSQSSKLKIDQKGLHSKSKVVSKQIAKLISAYTQAFNKRNNRIGTLFDSPFKRKMIDSETYLRNTIIYIHQNPKDITEDFRDYKYSSYLSFLSSSFTNLMRDMVVELFEDRNNFEYLHNRMLCLEDIF